MEVEEKFARAGGKVKCKSFFRRHEKKIVKPLVAAGLKFLNLYDRGMREALSPVVTELELGFPNLPRAFDGFRVLHLSDLHIDGVDGLTEVLVPMIEDIDHDVCLITGDYRFEDDGPCDEVYARMRAIVSALRPAHGVYGILGNHDEAAIAFGLEDMGVRMLVNDSVSIERGRDSIWLAGLDDDFDYKCDDLPGAMAQVPDDAFKVLLAHTPDLYREALNHNVHLYLCGHTHGGQVRIPKIGAVRSNARCPRPYTYRHWNHEGMHGYTSGGIGCSSLPVRLNCPPELVLITLRRSDSL